MLPLTQSFPNFSRMAFDSTLDKSTVVGFANIIISSGKTSGTPPTFVDTTNNPHDAASKIAIQNDSVKEQFKNICPRTNTFLTFACGTDPKNSTRSCNRSRSTISSNTNFFDPSPPMIKSTLSNSLQMMGMVSTNKSTPFLYTNREMTTILTLS